MASEIKVDTIVNAGGDNDSGIDLSTNDKVAIKTANVERMSVASTGATTITTAGNETTLTLKSTDADASQGPLLDLHRDSASPADDDGIGRVVFSGENDASEKIDLIQFIGLNSDVTDGTEDGRLQLYIHKDGSSINRMDFQPTETTFNDDSADVDFRVESNGNANALYVNAGDETVHFFTTDGNPGNNTSGVGAIINNEGKFLNAVNQSECAVFNRMGSDGNVVLIRQAGADEGSISVSGSTVSFNGFSGLHESSGIATNTPIGTVVSTIDELDIYPTGTTKAGQTRADHAKVEVSDTVGDSAVYGVVSRFDDNDKVFVASVGIGSVRVTGACVKGDLLESNGDGTAKVQSDDIVRSKTIGKVTIGNSNTGVKLVSCVLYCG